MFTWGVAAGNTSWRRKPSALVADSIPHSDARTRGRSCSVPCASLQLLLNEYCFYPACHSAVLCDVKSKERAMIESA
jgi:hypothetical protein